MKFIKLDLLTLLISLFLFASCENTSTIGLEIDPTSAVQGTLVDSITITSRTLKDDAVSTVSASSHPLGFLKDAIFGTSESSLAMAVNLPTAPYDFGTAAVIDSAVLVLNYASQFYGDSTATYTVNVHPLAINIAKESSFLSTRNWAYANTLIGSKTGRLYPTTPYKVTDVVVGKADTLRTVTPQIRIRLDKTYIQNNIANLSAANLKLNSTFAQSFKGLHVQMTSTGNGGMAFFEFGGTTSALVLYYKKQNATTTTAIDTVSVDFPIANNVAPIAATINHDYTATPIATQLSNPTLQYPITYLQPLSGLKNKIAFPYLRKFAGEVGKIAINKAELVIDMSAGTDVIPYSAAPRLALYRYDIAEQRQYVPDNDVPTQYGSGDIRAFSDPRVFGGYFNPLTKQYVFIITSYIQDLLDAKTIDYGTFLAPTVLTEFQLFPSINTAARTVIGSYKKTPVAGDNIMKLNIYYTKIK